MRVVLLQDVRGIGKRYEIADVPKGHALNFLIPRGLAEPATPEKVQMAKTRTLRAAESSAAEEEKFLAALAKLKGQKIPLTARANEKGSLFESVKAKDIQAALAAAGIPVDERHIMLDAPIKEVGEHEVMLKMGEHAETFTLVVSN